MSTIDQIMTEYARMRESGLATREVLQKLRHHVKPLTTDQHNAFGAAMRQWESQNNHNHTSAASNSDRFKKYAAQEKPTYELMPEVAVALDSKAEVTVTKGDWLSLMPTSGTPHTGLILYPGAHIPTDAYAPLARRIAQAGYFVALIYPKFNLSILDVSAADPIIEKHPQIAHWIVGGHSMGAAAATKYIAEENPNGIDGLILLGGYPGVDGLANRTDLKVTSIYATNDGVAAFERIEAAMIHLPETTQYIAIDGGNHAQFGYYGAQAGDLEATITREEQITQIVNAILELLATI